MVLVLNNKLNFFAGYVGRYQVCCCCTISICPSNQVETIAQAQDVIRYGVFEIKLSWIIYFFDVLKKTILAFSSNASWLYVYVRLKRFNTDHYQIRISPYERLGGCFTIRVGPTSSKIT